MTPMGEFMAISCLCFFGTGALMAVVYGLEKWLEGGDAERLEREREFWFRAGQHMERVNESWRRWDEEQLKMQNRQWEDIPKEDQYALLDLLVDSGVLAHNDDGAFYVTELGEQYVNSKLAFAGEGEAQS